MSGYVVLQPDREGLDFVDCTPTISPTLEQAREELAFWYDDIPGAAIYSLVPVEREDK